MKISVITACFNSAATLADTLDSVSAQNFTGLEHIVVDGGSSDNTLDIIRAHGKRVANLLQGPDKGIYDALNKGIRAATGDLVGIIHSDDIYSGPEVLAHVADFMERTGADACYGDLVYVDRADTGKVTRRWLSGDYSPEHFRYGWMPPHPAFFLKRKVYTKYGLYDISFPLASDYELMLRMLYRHRVSCAYLPEVLVKMRCGGASGYGLANTPRMLFENYRAWRSNGLPVNPLTFVLKPLRKLSQFVMPPAV